MKTLKVLLLALLLVSSVSAKSSHSTKIVGEDIEKEGFLTTQWCADRGMFADCRLETLFCKYEECYRDEKKFSTEINAQIVLQVHDEGKYYPVNFTHKVHLGEVLETAINRNEVTIIGKIKDGVIAATDFKAPPPPKKSFFKGCL
jgi:hypothetical protein